MTFFRALAAPLLTALAVTTAQASPVTITTLMIPGFPPSLTPVTDSIADGLGGTIIHDQLLAFSAGVAGAEVGGFVQNRVIQKTGSSELIFTWRLRDLVFGQSPGTPGDEENFIELITYGFPIDALSADLFTIDTTQSDGIHVLQPGALHGVSPDVFSVEINSYVTDPDGSTFFGFSTTATTFATTGWIDIGTSYFAGTGQLTTSTRVTGMAWPTFVSSPTPPVPLPIAGAGLLGACGMLAAARHLRGSQCGPKNAL